MKGKIILEISDVGVAVSSSLNGRGRISPFEIMHATSIALKMSKEDMKVYCLAEHFGIFEDAATVMGCENEEQLHSLLRGEQPDGTTINLTELEKQLHES